MIEANKPLLSSVHNISTISKSSIFSGTSISITNYAEPVLQTHTYFTATSTIIQNRHSILAPAASSIQYNTIYSSTSLISKNSHLNKVYSVEPVQSSRLPNSSVNYSTDNNNLPITVTSMIGKDIQPSNTTSNNKQPFSYMLVIGLLFGLAFISITVAATAFCIVVVITRRKPKPVVTVICRSNSKRSEGEPGIALSVAEVEIENKECVLDLHQYQKTVCSLEPVPIYEPLSTIEQMSSNITPKSIYSLSSSSIPTDLVTNNECDGIISNTAQYDKLEEKNQIKPPASPYETVYNNLCTL